MCVILTLAPTASIDHKKLENAIANNLDGFGLMLVDSDTKTIEVRKDYNPDGTDVDVVARMLEETKGLTRHLHLRNTTKGENGIDNVHPFQVFKNDTRTVFVAHNGTFHQEFCPPTGSVVSDTKVFAESFLSPMLSQFRGAFGDADYNDPLFQRILGKFVMGANRVLIVSNDLEPLRVGTWHTITNLDGSQFLASNNDYFSYISRGPRKPAAPFHQNNHSTMARSSHYGGVESKTTIGTNVVPFDGGVERKDATFPKTAVEEGQKEVGKKVGTNNALVVTKLAELDMGDKVFSPSEEFLNALGSQRSLYERYGFGSLTWITDDELAGAFKSIPVMQIAELFRALIEIAENFEEEADTASQVITAQKKEIQEDSAAIEMLEKEIEQLRLTNSNLDDFEESNRSLVLDNKLLLKQNTQMAAEVEFLREALAALGTTVPSRESILASLTPIAETNNEEKATTVAPVVEKKVA